MVMYSSGLCLSIHASRIRCLFWCSVCTRLIDSTPPATMMGTRSTMTRWAAIAIACIPDEQNRLTVAPPVVTGRPARSADWRPMFWPVAPSGMAHPMITSSTSAGSSPARFVLVVLDDLVIGMLHPEGTVPEAGDAAVEKDSLLALADLVELLFEVRLVDPDRREVAGAVPECHGQGHARGAARRRIDPHDRPGARLGDSLRQLPEWGQAAPVF